MKVCSLCSVEKGEDQFPRKRANRSGWANWCKECHYRRVREWKKNNPEKTKNIRLLHKFNITLEQYRELLFVQNGVCAICKQEEVISRNGKVLQLSVDHDRRCCPGERSCGKCVRGLLCQYCNTALGLMKDDREILKKAINYLERRKP